MGLQLLVGVQFQVLFHSPLGGLFTFPSRYWFTIGHWLIFSLTTWSWQIHTGFHVPSITRVFNKKKLSFRLQDYHLLWLNFPVYSTKKVFCNFFLVLQNKTLNPTTPTKQRLQTWHLAGLGCFPFARHYLGNHYCFLFLGLLRCFTSSGSHPYPMYSDMGN